MTITALALHHESALNDYVAEFANAGEPQINGYFCQPEWPHVKKVETLAAWEQGEDVGQWVASSTRFLIVDEKIVGNYNLRH